MPPLFLDTCGIGGPWLKTQSSEFSSEGFFFLPSKKETPGDLRVVVSVLLGPFRQTSEIWLNKGLKSGPRVP